MAPWKEVARLEQQHFLQIFGSTDWDLYRPAEKKLLTDKVGLVIFGPPGAGYERSQLARINEVTKAIEWEGMHGAPYGIWMSVVIVIVNPPKGHYYCHPVFRVPKYSDGSDRRHVFVDCVGRVYNSWWDFLKNNKLPKSELCYPVDGVYRQDKYGDVIIDFGNRKSSVLLKVADGASNLLALGSMGVAAAALALPLAAPLVAAVSVGASVSGVYGVARAAHDQVDRKKHGQSIGLANRQSLVNWGYIVGGVMGVRSGVECIQLSRSLSKAAKLGVTVRAVGALRKPSVTPPEMFRDIRAKAMLLQDVSGYVLLLCHTVAESVYIADFLNSDVGNNILHIKSMSFSKVEGDETVRHLEFTGIESGKLEDVLSKGICEYSCKFGLSFSCSVETFRSIKQYISDCIDTNLTEMTLENAKLQMKNVIDFLSRYDLTWVIELCLRILPLTGIGPTGEKMLSIFASFYFFLRKVINIAQSGGNVSFSAFKPTLHDTIEIVKICLNNNSTFDVKFSQLYESFLKPTVMGLLTTGLVLVLQKYICPSNTQNLNSVPKEEILKTASDLVGTRLDDSNAKVTFTDGEIYVIITDANIESSVVEIVQEKSGLISAKVLR